MIPCRRHATVTNSAGQSRGIGGTVGETIASLLTNTVWGRNGVQTGAEKGCTMQSLFPRAWHNENASDPGVDK
jgi:hypothetical protein